MENSELTIKADDIQTSHADWQFDSSVAKVFDDHVRKSVPFYDEIQSLVLRLADWTIHKEARILDLGCATGTTLDRLWQKYAAKNPRLIGIDCSADMLDKARQRLRDCPNALLVEENIENAFTGDFPSVSLVLSLYTLQFLHPRKRAEVCHQIFQVMEHRGMFILVEKVLDQDSWITDLYIQTHWDLKIEQGFDIADVYAKAASLRSVLTPLTVDENIAMLRAAGFGRVSIAFKWCNFAAFIAIK